MRYVKTASKYLAAIEDGHHADVHSAFKNGVIGTLRWMLNLTDTQPITTVMKTTNESVVSVKKPRTRKDVTGKSPKTFHPVPKPSEKTTAATL